MADDYGVPSTIQWGSAALCTYEFKEEKPIHQHQIKLDTPELCNCAEEESAHVHHHQHQECAGKLECDYTLEDCGCECNFALREYLKDCYDLGKIPPLHKCICAVHPELIHLESHEPRKPRDPKCDIDECQFTFEHNPDLQCPPMPTCDTCHCRPTWMSCPPHISAKKFQIPHGENIISNSQGLNKSPENFKLPANCPMGKPWVCGVKSLNVAVIPQHHEAAAAHHGGAPAPQANEEEEPKKEGFFKGIKAKFTGLLGGGKKEEEESKD